jgi:hypothetical protein
MRESSAVLSPASLWLCRLAGPALIAVLAAGYFANFPDDRLYDFIAGPVYLVAWVGAWLVLLDGRREGLKFSLPFVFVVLAIVTLAFSALMAWASPALRDAARVFHLFAALAFIAAGR